MRHYVLIGSAYTLGNRIALHFTEQKEVDRIFTNHSELIKKYPISIHIVEARGKDWESVLQSDKFFDNIRLIRNSGEFFKLLEKNENLSGLDVAYYILSKYQCCHTKLEKLVYFCYADYYTKTQKKLFVDKIYAFDYGPVVGSVFAKFKKKYDLQFDKQIQETYKEQPLRSRILASGNGVQKIFSINETLDNYANLSATDLVNLTHCTNSPWDKAPKGRYRTISDELIKNYHYNETLKQ